MVFSFFRLKKPASAATIRGVRPNRFLGCPTWVSRFALLVSAKRQKRLQVLWAIHGRQVLHTAFSFLLRSGILDSCLLRSKSSSLQSRNGSPGSDSGSAVRSPWSSPPRSGGECLAFSENHSGAGQPGRNNNHRLDLMVLYPNERLQFYVGIIRLRKGGPYGPRKPSKNPRFCKVV